MRHLDRLPEPRILTVRSKSWTADFINSGKARPDSSKYAHADIRLQLNTISSYKCFYCESILKDKPKEVDHFIEVSIKKELAYNWDNLYLSCDNCNNKLDDNTISVKDALDPCKDSDIEIEKNISFEDEQIIPYMDSVLGKKTIKKYRLNSELLDKRRINHLKEFLKFLMSLDKSRKDDGGRPLTYKEIAAIRRFTESDKPFSLMIKKFLINSPFS